MSGEAFDREFAKVMEEDHNKDIAAFEQEATSGVDKELKDFASDKLPVLRQHLAMAKDLVESLSSSP